VILNTDTVMVTAEESALPGWSLSSFAVAAPRVQSRQQGHPVDALTVPFPLLSAGRDSSVSGGGGFGSLVYAQPASQASQQSMQDAQRKAAG